MHARDLSLTRRARHWATYGDLPRVVTKLALREREGELRRSPITRADLEEAIAKNKPSSGSGNAQRFAEYAREHGSA